MNKSCRIFPRSYPDLAKMSRYFMNKSCHISVSKILARSCQDLSKIFHEQILPYLSKILPRSCQDVKIFHEQILPYLSFQNLSKILSRYFMNKSCRYLSKILPRSCQDLTKIFHKQILLYLSKILTRSCQDVKIFHEQILPVSF